MTSKHTPGKVKAHSTLAERRGEGKNTPFISATSMGEPLFIVADVYGGERSAANCQYFAACWNACEGIENPEAIPEMIHLLGVVSRWDKDINVDALQVAACALLTKLNHVAPKEKESVKEFVSKKKNPRLNPTKEGKKRHPPDGIYKGDYPDDEDMWHACTCKPGCPGSCKGKCGCRACYRAYNDFLTLPETSE